MADDLRDLFATNLRRLRHDRGLSQDELADQAEVSRSYLAQVETAKKHISLKIIAKLAHALDIDPVEFFRRPPHRDRAKQ
jgi:transcriptional regulator with XRE-family HTH domain